MRGGRLFSPELATEKEVVIEVVDDTTLIVYDKETEQELARHALSHEKGKLIKNNNHGRDYSKGIDKYIETVSVLFSNPSRARILLEAIRAEKPRYTRDQLQSIQQNIKNVDKSVTDKALEFCLSHNLYNATDFIDAVEHFKKKQAIKEPFHNKGNLSEIKPINETDRSKLKTKPQIRDVKIYQQIMEEGKTCREQLLS